MREKIYTIPVNEAFAQNDKCPFCIMKSRLEETEIDRITGASMMDPDIRIKTNEAGFCRKHYDMMCRTGRKLSVALTIQSHLAELRKDITPGGLFVKDNADRPVKRIAKLEGSCYICKNVDEYFEKMVETACLLYENEPEFRERLDAQKLICLPHYKMFLETSKKMNSKKMQPELVKAASAVVDNYLASLYDDVSLFCKKFDYNYHDTPWGNSKDSIERSLALLTGETVLPEKKRNT